MKLFIIVSLVAMLGVEMALCCSCMGNFKHFMCSADFVAKVKAEDDQQPSMNGPFQEIEVLEEYKGRDDVSRIYSSRRKPGEPMNSCESAPLEKNKIYLISGNYYDDDGDDEVDSIFYSGCQVITRWNKVTAEQFLFIEFLRDGVADCLNV